MINLILVALFLPLFICAQPAGKITGSVVDAATRQPLEGATISVMHQESGLFINHAVSSKRGTFQVNGLPLNQAVEIIVSFTGYRDTVAVRLLAEKITATGQWWLRQHSGDLDSVLVTARKPPFVIRKDTIEFDANAFRSLPADMLEDLLRQLPGMAIDEQGNVTVNGKKVNKIKIDGRDFFSGNIKAALQNLPGMAIDKIQVYDTRERGTEHNSIIRPLTNEVTLNVGMKKKSKNARFGHADLSGGSAARYSADAFLNRFNDEKRESLFAGTGNAPSGTTMRDDAGTATPTNGLLKSSANAGFNINRSLIGHDRFNASFTTQHTNQASETQTDRTNLLPDSTFSYSSNTMVQSADRSHNLRFSYENDIDTLQQLSISPVVAFTTNNIESVNDARSYAVSPVNALKGVNTSRNRSFNLSNSLNYSRSSRDKKSNVSVSWSLGVVQSNAAQINRNVNVFYTNSMTGDSTDQNSITGFHHITNSLSVNLSHSFSKRITAIVNYTFMQTADNASRDTYNYNVNSGKHDLLDSLYSMHNDNLNHSQLPAVSIGYRAGKWSLELGVGFRQIRQINRLIWQDSSVEVLQRTVIPNLAIAKNFSDNSQWITNYSVDTRYPSADQLNPVQDNSNPLYLRIGNPYLRSAITHNVQSALQFFSRDYRWHSGVTGSATASNSQVVDNTYYDSLGRQITGYANTRGNRNFNLSVNGGTRAKWRSWDCNVDISAVVGDNRSTAFTNEKENVSRTIRVSPQVNVSIHYKQAFFLQINAGVDMNSTTYSLTGIDAIDYNTRRLVCWTRVVPIRRLVINSSLNYFYNSQLPKNFQRSRTLLNGSVHYSLLKSERLSVGMAIVDILNNNVSTTRTVSATAIENVQSMTLKRYAMLSISYILNSFH